MVKAWFHAARYTSVSFYNRDIVRRDQLARSLQCNLVPTVPEHAEHIIHRTRMALEAISTKECL